MALGAAVFEDIAPAIFAIMIAGVLVLPEVMLEITEAPTTRSAYAPWTRSRASTTARGSLDNPIFAVPTGRKIVVLAWFAKEGELAELDQVAHLHIDAFSLNLASSMSMKLQLLNVILGASAKFVQ